MKVVRVKIEPNWNGNYRLEYDGKYVTLFGEDKDYVGFKFNKDTPDWYEEMVLHPTVCEGRNLTPEILEEKDGYLYIKIGADDCRCAWVEPEDILLY